MIYEALTICCPCLFTYPQTNISFNYDEVDELEFQNLLNDEQILNQGYPYSAVNSTIPPPPLTTTTTSVAGTAARRLPTSRNSRLVLRSISSFFTKRQSSASLSTSYHHNQQQIQQNSSSSTRLQTKNDGQSVTDFWDKVADLFRRKNRIELPMDGDTSISSNRVLPFHIQFANTEVNLGLNEQNAGVDEIDVGDIQEDALELSEEQLQRIKSLKKTAPVITEQPKPLIEPEISPIEHSRKRIVSSNAEEVAAAKVSSSSVLPLTNKDNNSLIEDSET